MGAARGGQERQFEGLRPAGRKPARLPPPARGAPRLLWRPPGSGAARGQRPESAEIRRAAGARPQEGGWQPRRRRRARGQRQGARRCAGGGAATSGEGGYRHARGWQERPGIGRTNQGGSTTRRRGDGAAQARAANGAVNGNPFGGRPAPSRQSCRKAGVRGHQPLGVQAWVGRRVTARCRPRPPRAAGRRSRPGPRPRAASRRTRRQRAPAPRAWRGRRRRTPRRAG
jgi:hypothetical protein